MDFAKKIQSYPIDLQQKKCYHSFHKLKLRANQSPSSYHKLKRIMFLRNLLALTTLAVSAVHTAMAAHGISLSGDMQVPPVESDATGVAVFNIADDGMSIDYVLNVTNPSMLEIFGAAGAHVHCGMPDENGPVSFFMAPAEGLTTEMAISVTGTITDADITATDCGSTVMEVYTAIYLAEMYVNVHSTGNPSGEIRGSYTSIDMLEVELTGDQQVPPVDTDVTGLATFETTFGYVRSTLEVMNPSGVELFGDIGAHIHCGDAMSNGPVVVLLYTERSFLEAEFESTMILTDASVVNPTCGSTIDEVMEMLSMGMAYVNVHSVPNMGGEVRGTVMDMDMGTMAPSVAGILLALLLSLLAAY